MWVIFTNGSETQFQVGEKLFIIYKLNYQLGIIYKYFHSYYTTLHMIGFQIEIITVEITKYDIRRPVTVSTFFWAWVDATSDVAKRRFT